MSVRKTRTQAGLAVLVMLITASLACSLGTSSTAPTADSGQSNSSSPTDTPAAQQAGSAPGSCKNPLYPVVEGATYSYTTTSQLGGTSYTKTVSAVQSDGFTVTEVFKTGTTQTREWKCTADGLVSLAPVGGSSDTVTSPSTNVTLSSTTNTGVTFPTAVTQGQTWTQTFTDTGKISRNGVDIATETVTTQTFTANGMESVTVPAGTFNAMKITVHADVKMTETLQGQSRTSDIPSDSTLWYAPGVGEVKAAGSALGLTGTTELTSYKIP